MGVGLPAVAVADTADQGDRVEAGRPPPLITVVPAGQVAVTDSLAPALIVTAFDDLDDPAELGGADRAGLQLARAD